MKIFIASFSVSLILTTLTAQANDPKIHEDQPKQPLKTIPTKTEHETGEPSQKSTANVLPSIEAVQAQQQSDAAEKKDAEPESQEKLLSPDEWPTTLEATVISIINGLSDENKHTLRSTKKAELIRYHHGWGTWIRNHYGLWRGNDKLREDACGGILFKRARGKNCHPDDASMWIIKAVWRTLNHPPYRIENKR